MSRIDEMLAGPPVVELVDAIYLHQPWLAIAGQ